MDAVSGISEKETEETISINTSTDDSNSITSNDAVAGVPSSASATLSKQQEEELLRILMDDLSSDNKQVIYGGLTALLDFSSSGGERPLSPSESATAKFIIGNDGVGLIMMVLKRNPTDVDILVPGSLILANLMSYSPVARDKIHLFEGAKMVINGMKDNPDSKRLQHVGCFFLRKFTMNNKDRMQLVVNLNGIPTIVSAMKNHHKNRRVQQWAISALHAFCFKKDFVGRVYEAGGYSAMVRAEEFHKFRPNLKAAAKGAIKALHEYYQSTVQE